MDGITAAGLIMQNREFKVPPIIAMTADAMSGIEKTVLDAGMKDYITKPINIKEFFATLEKWIQPGKREPIEKNRTPGHRAVIRVPEIRGINVLDGLTRIGGSSTAYLKLLRSFANNNAQFKAHTELQQIITAVTEVLAEIKTPEREKVRQADIKELRGVIGKLQAAIRDSDTESSEILTQLEEMVSDADMVRIAAEIRKWIDGFDYEKALELLETIKV